MRKVMTLALAATFILSCTDSEADRLEARLDFYVEQNELCLEEADGLVDIMVCSDRFNKHMDAEFDNLERKLDEIYNGN